MKLKAECDFSGTDKDQYIKDYKTHFNIELDKDNVKKNSQMKEIIKASGLTSLSGRCGLTYQTLVNEMFNGNDKAQIYSYLELNKKFKPKLFHFVQNKKDIIQIQYKGQNRMMTNWARDIFLSIFITSYSRIKLHKVVHLLGKDVIYTDTDSVKFLYTEENMKKLNEVKIYKNMGLIGNLIGQFGYEYEINPTTKKPRKLVEIIVLNRKQYALRFDDETSIIKLCGVSNCQTQFSEILDLLDNEKNIVIEQKRTKKNLCLGLSEQSQEFNLKIKNAGKIIKILDKNMIQYLPFGFTI